MLRGIGKQSGESVESVLVLSNSKLKKNPFRQVLTGTSNLRIFL